MEKYFWGAKVQKISTAAPPQRLSQKQEKANNRRDAETQRIENQYYFSLRLSASAVKKCF
jgi:hypothetical protein